MTTSLQKPVVHLNGSSRRHLADTYQAAMDALRMTLLVLRDTAPHGRDYYPLDGALTRAQEQHRERMQRVEAVLAEYVELHAHVVIRRVP